MTSPDTFFQSLYETQYEKMVKFAFRMIGSMDSAQDLVQEAFLLALFNLDELSCHPNPEGWLMKTLRNLARNERRRIQNHADIPLDSLAQILGKEPDIPFELLLPPQLSKAERDILIWRFKQELDYREIADRLGISEEGCRSRLSRAVAHCRKLMNTS